jgi:hypothetical protein
MNKEKRICMDMFLEHFGYKNLLKYQYIQAIYIHLSNLSYIFNIYRGFFMKTLLRILKVYYIEVLKYNMDDKNKYIIIGNKNRHLILAKNIYRNRRGVYIQCFLADISVIWLESMLIVCFIMKKCIAKTKNRPDRPNHFS